MRSTSISRVALFLAASSLCVASSGALQAEDAPSPSASGSSSLTSSYDDNAIPEPGTWGLLVAGGAVAAGHVLSRRRKSNAQNG